MNEKNYLIPKFEEKLEEIKRLQQKIDNPSPNRRLTVHRMFKEQLVDLKNDKEIHLYQQLKEIVKLHHLFLKDKKEICYFKGTWSPGGNPFVCYFLKDSMRPTKGISTPANCHFQGLTPKEFIEKLMSGEGFIEKS